MSLFCRRKAPRNQSYIYIYIYFFSTSTDASRQQQLRFFVFQFFVLCSQPQPTTTTQPCPPSILALKQPAAPAPKVWATGNTADVVAVSAPAPAPAAASASSAVATTAPVVAVKAGRRLLAPAIKKAAGELRVDDPKVDEGVIAPAAAAATTEETGARNGFALRPPGSPDVSAAEVAAVAASASAPSSAASAKPLLQARVDSALVARGNGDAAPLYEVRAGDTNAREPQTAADADVGLDYVRPGDAEGKTVLTSPKKLEAEEAAKVAEAVVSTAATTATTAATAAESAAASPAPAEATSTTTTTAPFDPLASTAGLQLSIPSSEAGTAWNAVNPNDNTITASFDASSPGYLVGGGSGDSGVAVCAGRGLALVVAGGAVSVFTAEGVRKAGPTPLSTFFRGVEKHAAASSSSVSSKDKKVVPTGSWSSARCVYDESSSTPEAERQFYLAAIFTPAPASSAAEDASSSSTSSSSSASQLIVAATAEGDPAKTWAGPFVVNADGLVGQGNGTSTAETTTPVPPAAPQPLPGLGRCAPAGCDAKELALGIDAHALWATFDLFTSSSSSEESSSASGNAAAASRVGASAVGLSRAQLRAGTASKRPTTVALSNFPAWTRALTPATTSPRAKHDSRAGGTQYLVAVSGGAGSGAAAAKNVVASPLVVDDGDASKGTLVAAWSVTGTGTLVDGCKDGSPLASTETTYVTKSAAPVAAFFGGGEAKKETATKTDGDNTKVSSSSTTSSSSSSTAAAAVARAPRTLGGAADVSSTRRVGSVTLANGATTGARKLWVALSTPVRVGAGESSGGGGGESKTETPPVLGASLLAFEIAPNSVEQASVLATEVEGQQQQRSKPSLIASTTALLALPSASIVAPAATLARGNGTLVGISFVTVAADLPPSLAYATFTPEAGVSSVRLLAKGVSPLSAFVAPSATFPSSSFASFSAPGNPRAAPAPSASLQRLTTTPRAAALSQQHSPPLPMPRYSGATTDAEGGWWFAGQVTGCKSSANGGSGGSSVGSAATSSAAKAASLSSSPSCKPVTVYTVARVKAVPLE